LTSNVHPNYVFRKLLRTLDTMRSCAERGPTPDPELVAIHGERACINSAFAMLGMMAESCIETIEELGGVTLAEAHAEMAPRSRD
jgi:hypothetical protein